MKVYHLCNENLNKSYLEIIQASTKFTEDKLTEMALKGAIWLQKKSTGPTLRLRDIKQTSQLKDKIWIYFDPKVLALPEFTQPQLVHEEKGYGVYYKPAGIPSQGSQTGDHATMLRAIEKIKGEAFLIHRLDRETSGLMVVGYNNHAAKFLSNEFQNHRVKKKYLAKILGIPQDSEGKIEFPLDGKDALTIYKVLEVQGENALIDVEIKTGRMHQIRRHFDMLSHPVMGDPKYGKGNKNRTGLELYAYFLEFRDPYSKKIVSFKFVPENLASVV